MVPQVLDAKGDIRDCQREHPSRKLAAPSVCSSPAETSLSNCVIGSFCNSRDRAGFRGYGDCVSIAQLQNCPLSILNSEEPMLNSDRWIGRNAQQHDMINPFSEKQVREGVISYGLSSYGYDLRGG
jgi:hypothetical protein